jgi:hypothetical protein
MGIATDLDLTQWTRLNPHTVQSKDFRWTICKVVVGGELGYELHEAKVSPYRGRFATFVEAKNFHERLTET